MAADLESILFERVTSEIRTAPPKSGSLTFSSNVITAILRRVLHELGKETLGMDALDDAGPNQMFCRHSALQCYS